MSQSEGESLNSDSEISVDESMHSSDENFINDEDDSDYESEEDSVNEDEPLYVRDGDAVFEVDITYQEVQKMSFENFVKYIDYLRLKNMFKK